MRPARRWTGVLPGIWLAGLMTTAGQGIPPASPPGVTVSGLVATSDHAPLQSGAVLMNPVVGDTLASHPADDGRFLPDGSFSFRNVLPGEYQIRARAQTVGGPPLFAGYRIHVRDRDITDVRLLLRPGATVTGTVEVDAADSGARAPSFASLRVRAPFVDGSSFADALTGVVQKDGRFRLVGVMEGEHYFTLEGLTGPWVLQHVHWRGTDLTDAPLAAASGDTIRDVRITITARATEIRGTVRDAAGQPAGDATVVMSPVSYTTWLGGSRRFVITRTDAGGRYHHRGLPAGDYRLLASRELRDVDVRASRARELPGVHVSLNTGERREIDLVLASRPVVIRIAAAR